MTKHLLGGIRPEPLASYLAGLGLIRVLGEQADPELSAWWDAAGLVVETTVDDLAGWFTGTFVPTPVLRAWNQGSGFGTGDGAPSAELAELLAIPSPRLDPYRATLRAANDAARRSRDGWSNEEVARQFRNRCPQESLAWIDAATVLADGDLLYPPLLGTGGNDGRFDFSGNLHQHLVKIFDPTDAARRRSDTLIRDLLGGTQEAPLAPMAVGQFDPAAAGGRNSSPFGAADSVVNPWGYVLMMEGAMMFAATANRRNLHGAGRAAIPFTVRASPDGSPSGADEVSRGEVWAPLWGRHLSYREIRQLFSESRAAWRGKQAVRAVDFYAATRTLGVTRGIGSFVRYGIHQRNGQAHVAVPIERVVVANKPTVELAAGLEDWVRRVRSSDTSTPIAQAVRRFEQAQMAFVQDGGPLTMGRLLATLTELELAVGRSGRAREAVPVRQPPPAHRFLALFADQVSAELRVAVGIASCRTRRGLTPARTMRQLLLPIDPGAQRQEWRDSPVVPGLGVRRLAAVLADVLTWRARTANEQPGENEQRARGATAFPAGVAVPAADLHGFARHELDERLLMMWLKACLALDWRAVSHRWPDSQTSAVPLPTLAVLHALAAGMVAEGPDDDSALALEPDWPSRLAGGQVTQVHDEAARRLRRVGLVVAPSMATPPRVSGVDIAAALVPRCAKPREVLLHYVAAPLRPLDPQPFDTDLDDQEPEEEQP